jgi:signal transduction histidine kinase
VNRLWVRLSLAFAAYALSAAAVLLVSGVLLGRDARRAPLPLRMQEPGGLAATVSAAYDPEDGWARAFPAMAGAQAVAPPGLLLVLTDPAGQRVWPAEATARDPLAPVERVPLTVAGRRVGTLEVWRAAGGPPDMQGRLEQGLMFLGLVAGVLGILFGVIVSRGLTAPLDRLAGAARGIGAGDLSRRVAVSGGAELQAVGASFNKMAESLERAEVRRQQLVADVAHELRTPVSVLQANLQAMLDGVFRTDPDELRRLHDQTLLLGRLVGDLEDLARADAGQLTLQRAPVVLGELVQDTVAALVPVAEAAQLHLAVQAPSGLRPLDADGARLAQVLNNLVMNAIRHTPAGGHVTVQLAEERAGQLLRVVDDGAGIDPTDLPFVFERFYRADPARQRAKGGAGLGLPIARAIVLAHGGEITVTSAGLGQGVVAEVRLPLAGGGAHTTAVRQT